MRALHKTVLVGCLSALVTGCQTYTPKPISAATSATAFESRTLDNPELMKFISLELTRGGKPDPTSSWDLTRLTLAGLYYHPDIAVARARLAAARAGVITAGQVPNPSLGVGASYDSTTVTPSPWTVGPILNFLVETFGRRQYRTAEAKARAESAREALATAGWQVRGRVRSALLDLWAARKRIDLLRQRLELQNQLVGLLERRFAAGEASSLDVTRERINGNQISLAIREAERRSAEASVRLASAVGIPARALDRVTIAFDALDKPVSFDPAKDAGALRRKALQDRTDIQGLLAEYAAAQSALQLQIASQFPNLTLGPGYTYDQGDNKFDLNLAADLPIFNQNQGPIAEARARRQEVADRFMALQARIIGAIDVAIASYRGAARTLDTADTLLNSAEARERQVSRSFRVGQVDRPTLVTAELEVAAVRLSRLDALTQQRQALGSVEDALQQPLFDPGRWPMVPETDPRRSHMHMERSS